MATALDLRHKRFGSLTAIERHENDDVGRAYWVCACDCGGAHIARAAYLREGRTTRCPECAAAPEAVCIDAWYHVTLLKEAVPGFSQGSAGFCVVTRWGEVMMEPFWLEAPHKPQRPAPVLIETLRECAKRGLIRCQPDNASLHRWLKRNTSRITFHSHNEGNQVWEQWRKRTGEWRGPASGAPMQDALTG